MSILKLRKEIDEIDNDIVELLSKRKNAVKKIASIKKKLDKPIVDNHREQQIIDRLKKIAKKKNLDEDLIISLYRIVIKNSRDEQKNSE